MLRYFVAGIAVLVVVGFFMRDTGSPVKASAEIDIKAPLDKVWGVQTDIARWQEWNADIEEMKVNGPLAAGTDFVWKAGGMTIHSTIQDVADRRHIIWTGKTMGIDAIHKWEFTSANGVTHVYTEEEFSGMLAWLLPGTMREVIRNALQHGVQVLKVAAENKG
ncbi:MAG: SRPBCC family protein [Sideroxydans sp.]|nr:SRPBCC family protein [Sideroxydans sp.]